MTLSISVVVLIVMGYFLSSQWQSLAPKKFDLNRQFSKRRAAIGESVTLITTMTNNKWMPLPWVSIHSKVPGPFSFEGYNEDRLNQEEMGEHSLVTSFLFYERVRRHDAFTCNQRGYYRLEQVSASFGDLFGFTKAEAVFSVDDGLYVYPEIKKLSAFKWVPDQYLGDVSVKRWINPDPITSIGTRQYTHDDAFSTIDWKATAKVGELQVKKADYTSDPYLMVFFDVQTNQTHWNNIDKMAIERGVMLCAATCDEALKNRIPVGLCHNSVDAFARNATFIEPSLSDRQKQSIMDALTLVTPYRGIAMASLMHQSLVKLRPGTTVVFICAYVSDEIRTALNIMSRKGIRVKVLITRNDASSAKLYPPIECHLLAEEEGGLL